MYYDDDYDDDDDDVDDDYDNDDDDDDDENQAKNKRNNIPSADMSAASAFGNSRWHTLYTKPSATLSCLRGLTGERGC